MYSTSKTWKNANRSGAKEVHLGLLWLNELGRGWRHLLHSTVARENTILCKKSSSSSFFGSCFAGFVGFGRLAGFFTDGLLFFGAAEAGKRVAFTKIKPSNLGTTSESSVTSNQTTNYMRRRENTPRILECALETEIIRPRDRERLNLTLILNGTNFFDILQCDLRRIFIKRHHIRVICFVSILRNVVKNTSLLRHFKQIWIWECERIARLDMTRRDETKLDSCS